MGLGLKKHVAYVNLTCISIAGNTEAEGDGVNDVTKQLEKQALEDKEKEEEGEEGKGETMYLHQASPYGYSPHTYSHDIIIISPQMVTMARTQPEKRRRRKRRRKDVSYLRLMR